MRNTNRNTYRTIRNIVAAVAVSVVALASFSAQAAQEKKGSFSSGKSLSTHLYQDYVVPAGFSINLNLSLIHI